MQYTRRAAPLLLALVLAACQIGGPAAPVASPAAGPTAAPTVPPPATAGPGPAVGSIAPVDAQVPESFTATSEPFARFSPPSARSGASVAAPAIAPDLSNVELTVLLSPEQKARIGQAGFAVSPGDAKEFYELYERARYGNVPPFVTSDSILHVYHLLFDKALRTAETAAFIPILTRLDWELLRTSAAQYEALSGTPWADAARRNAAYFAVAVKLLDPSWEVPEGLRDLAEPDLQSIAAHDRIGPSAIFPAYPRGEDWSQYVPRGHYTKSEALRRYFTAMMWHGRMTFRADDANETRQAALLTLALRQATVDGRPAEALWSGIYEPTVFFVGRSDDLTPQEYGGALDAAYGELQDATDLLDEARFARFHEAARALRAPEILGMVVGEGMGTEEATKGLRFMGQRFVPDAWVFGQLIAERVPGRPLPKALDFFAALGSDRALEHLEDSGDAAMPNYAQNMEKLRAAIAGYDEEVWTQNLYWSWIHSLRPLLDPPDEGYPQFMRSDAWLDKQLTTALGSWTELKHDTILYAKQVYAEGAGGGPPPPEPAKGYVEPVPLLYARLAALGQMTVDGLAARGLIAEADRVALEQMVDVAGRLQTMAEKQLRGEALSDEEYEFLRFYGRTLEGLTFAAGDPEGDSIDQAALVADVATDPGGQVLEEAIGRVFEIYVVAPVEGRLVLTKGGVFSHYEFAQPLGDRLTDEAWRARVDAGDLPPLAGWTGSFVVEQKAEGALQDAIAGFNTALANAAWYTDPRMVEQFLAEPELGDTSAYIDGLKARGQFVAMKRLSLAFLSFDFQDERHATVATRERWSDELYEGTPADMGGTPTKIGARGPYETNVTYTMERAEDGRWTITEIVTRPEPPPWS